MELYDEQAEQKKSKVPMVIGISIAVLLVLTIFIVIGIIYLKNSITTINIDGVRNKNIEEIFYTEKTENGIELYIPIIQMSKYLKYEGFTGDYKEMSEDKTKCHVKNDYETVMFILDSDEIVKITGDSQQEYIKIDKPVFEKNGELYTTIDGIEKAFNVTFSYDENFKNINIYSMNYLVKYHAKRLKIKEYSTDFQDKKAIFQNMIIKIDSEQYGVIDIKTGNAILENKYEKIKYLPTQQNFLVKSNGKYGIMKKNAEVKIRTVYDNIKIMDNQNELYLVKQNDSYGIVNSKGEVIIEPEYKQIGINVDKYTKNGVENKYVLLNEIILIKNEQDLWGMFNLKGEQITEFKYTGIGCQAVLANNSYPILVIPNHKIIVVKKDKYYNLVTVEGKELAPENIISSVYLKENVETGQNQYFMTSNNNEKVVNIEEWLTSIGR